MAGPFGRFHLPTTHPWQRPIALLRAKAAKPGGGKMSTRVLAQQRLDVLDNDTSLITARPSRALRAAHKSRANGLSQARRAGSPES